LELHNVKAEAVNYQGRAAVRVKDAAATDVDDAGRLATVPGTSLQDGAIEISLSGDTTV
jgi:hypothetical protein